MPSTIPSRPIVRAKRLNDLAYEFLRELVISGTLAPGERVNEMEIAASLGISRGPVREAVQRLASEGLLDFVPHRGAFVPTLSALRISHLYEVRAAVECAAARWAALRRTPDNLAAMEGTLEQADAILNSGAEVPYPIDLDLHREIVGAAANPILLAHAENVHLQLTFARSSSGYQPSRARDAHAEHRLIIHAIANRDGEGAEWGMRNHLEQSLSSVLALA